MQEKLTYREKEVFTLLLDGLVPKEIAGKLKVSYGTVVSHQRRLYRKLDVHSVKELLEKYKDKKEEVLYIPAEKRLKPFKHKLLIPAAAAVILIFSVLFGVRYLTKPQIDTIDTIDTTTVSQDYNFFLRASRWGEPGKNQGEGWTSGDSIVLKDFPADFDRLYDIYERYTVIARGISNAALENPQIIIYGLNNNDEWIMLGSTSYIGNNNSVPANVPFTLNIDLVVEKPAGINDYHDLTDYKEFMIAFGNLMWSNFPDNPEWNVNFDRIPEDIPHWHIMATVMDFSVEIVDKMQIYP